MAFWQALGQKDNEEPIAPSCFKGQSSHNILNVGNTFGIKTARCFAYNEQYLNGIYQQELLWRNTAARTFWKILLLK